MLMTIIGKVHPMLSPLCSFNSSQSRFNRFAAYLTQINVCVVLMALWFGPDYRQQDTMRQEVFLDSRDMEQI
jgi:hypothetical protein